jgi:hypothetical protein
VYSGFTNSDILYVKFTKLAESFMQERQLKLLDS